MAARIVPLREGSCLSVPKGEALVLTAILDEKNVAMKKGPGLCSRLLRLMELIRLLSAHLGREPKQSLLGPRPGGVGERG